MSRYAKIVQKLPVTVPSYGDLGRHCELLPGHEVKCVKLVQCEDGKLFDGTRYFFQARGPSAPNWIEVWTSADLPEFTDRGRERRQKRQEARREVARDGLASGRPATKDASERIGLRLRADQRAWLDAQSSDLDLPLSDTVLAHLVSCGMPA